jgi:hypothetical protein
MHEGPVGSRRRALRRPSRDGGPGRRRAPTPPDAGRRAVDGAGVGTTGPARGPPPRRANAIGSSRTRTRPGSQAGVCTSSARRSVDPVRRDLRAPARNGSCARPAHRRRSCHQDRRLRRRACRLVVSTGVPERWWAGIARRPSSPGALGGRCRRERAGRLSSPGAAGPPPQATPSAPPSLPSVEARRVCRTAPGPVRSTPMHGVPCRHTPSDRGGQLLRLPADGASALSGVHAPVDRGGAGHDGLDLGYPPMLWQTVPVAS